MTATLLDAAMTNCLFAQGCCAVTADLHIRYRLPVTSTSTCVVRAWVEHSTPPLFVLRAELTQECSVCATATAKFMERPQEVGNVGEVGAGTAARSKDAARDQETASRSRQP